MRWRQDKDGLPCRPSLLVSPSLRLTSTQSEEPHSVCNLAPGLYIRAVRPPIQGDGLSRLHSGGPSPHSSNLFPLAYLHCKNFRAFNRGTRAQTLSETRRRALAWTSIITCVFGYYHRLPRAVWHTYKFTSQFTKYRQLCNTNHWWWEYHHWFVRTLGLITITAASYYQPVVIVHHHSRFAPPTGDDDVLTIWSSGEHYQLVAWYGGDSHVAAQ
jgi:hypothetical protein